MGLLAESSRDSIPHALALQLCQALRQTGKLQRAPDLTQWAHELTGLIAQVPPARVRAVLDWHCQNLNRSHHVQAYSAKTFRAKFEQIEQGMPGTPRLPSGAVTPESQRAAERLTLGRLWPANVVPYLPALVQLGQDHLRQFAARLERHGHTLAEWDRNHRFILRVLEIYLWPCIVEEQWLPLMHGKYCRRSYHGDPLNLCFNWHGDDFRQHFWWEWAQEWAGPAHVQSYDTLLDTLSTYDTEPVP